MIKLFSLKQQKKDGTDPNGKSGMGQKKSSAAQLRITKGRFLGSWHERSAHRVSHDLHAPLGNNVVS